MAIQQIEHERINIVIPSEPTELAFATTNIDKLDEIARITGVPLSELRYVDLGEIDEIQEIDPLKVAKAKAKAAWLANGRTPVIVEETSLDILAIREEKKPPDVKAWTKTRQLRAKVCGDADVRRDPTAVAKVIFAIYDGQEYHWRIGETHGRIAEQPTENLGFGWDDIFIPDEGDGRTFGQMSSSEKDQFSMRRRALEKLRDNPFDINRYIFQLPAPYQMQMEAINAPELASNPTALKHAYQLRVLEHAGIEPSDDLSVPADKWAPYKEISYAPGFSRYVLSENQPDLGFLTTPMDTAVDVKGRPYRLDLDANGKIIFWQMGPDAMKRALASRAREFQLFHNEHMYATYREMLAAKERGERVTPLRSNARSAVIEKIIGMIKKGEAVPEDDYEREWREVLEEEYTVVNAASVQQVGYARQYSASELMSRTEAANTGLITDAAGIPSSLFAIGGMPPVSGAVDVVTGASLSMMDNYIPHNSIYADNFELRLEVFRQAKHRIELLNLPRDIERLVIAHIGMAFGTEKPAVIEKQIKAFMAEGGSLVRMYTTNPDFRKTDAVKAMRQAGGNDLRICVGPLVDMDEAYALIGPDIYANILYGGHGGGENCTSIDGGNGAYTGLELAYLMSLDPAFNNVAIGLEGGTGTEFGALLAFIDIISLNRRGIAGGIESGTGGLYAQHSNGRIVVPYWGSASTATQWWEAIASPHVHEKRLDAAGRLLNVEGNINYMTKPRSINSMVDAWFVARMIAGRVLADQRSRSIAEFRNHVRENGYTNHREIPNAARAVAKSHTSNGT